MKRMFLVTVCLLAAVMINAQSLEEIVKNYSAANKFDNLSALKTIKITAKMSMMGMDIPMEIWMKNPNKIKNVMNINGQEMIQVFDGTKGFIVNPMTGSTDPVEMTGEQAKSLLRSNIFSNYMTNYLKDGLLTLDGEDVVNGKPAFKVKAAVAEGTTATMFIDKTSYLLVKTTAEVNQGGQTMSVESYPSDYADNGGVFLPMKNTTSVSGMDMVTEYTKVEVDLPMDDSLFVITKK